MKKTLITLLCSIIVLSACACQRNNTQNNSSLLNSSQQNESIILSIPQESSSENNTSNNIISSLESNSTNNSSTSNSNESSIAVNNSSTSNVSNKNDDKNEENTYKNIVCNKIFNFQQIGLSIKGNNTMLFITIPKNWELKKSSNGYDIISNSKSIGSITKTQPQTNNTENVFSNEITTNEVKITHVINSTINNNKTSYNRTLCYNYSNNNQNIYLSFAYQEVDSDAIYKMLSEVKESTAYTKSNMGIINIQDNRNKILILGNSFINSSSIGHILQTMCGTDMQIEAHSRGYAHVGTYTKDSYMMQNIAFGNYSAVFMCGLYDYEAVTDLADMIKVCEDSNTKLVIFPAHNENRKYIDSAINIYPNTLVLDWKTEIDNLINTGISASNFCIPDAHNHSTPLAGYVGAHMIYRAIFNKTPQTTQFAEVSKTQIDLLGEYITSGSITLIDKSLSYEIE